MIKFFFNPFTKKLDKTSDEDIVGNGISLSDIPTASSNQISNSNEVVDKSMEMVKSFSLEDPSNSEDWVIFQTPVAITITKVVAVIRGSETPSLTINLKTGSNRASLIDTLFSSNQAITNTTTGEEITSLQNESLSAGDFLSFVTTALSGTVNEISVSIYYTYA